MPKATKILSQKIAADMLASVSAKVINKKPNKKQAQTKPVIAKASQPVKGKAKAKASQPVKAKPVPIKEASKPIKKAPKVTTAPVVAAKQKRPSNPPKRPSNSYNLFTSQMQIQMKEMPKFKAMPFQQKSQVIAQSWQKLSDEQKEPYNQKVIEEKQRYEKELKQFEKLGWFRNKDGQDSRDLYKAPKKSEEEKAAVKQETTANKKAARSASKTAAKDKIKAAKAKEAAKVKAEKSKSVAKKAAAKAKEVAKKEALKAKEAAKEEKRKIKEAEDKICKPKIIWRPFFFFSQENRVKLLKANPNLSITEVAKQNGEDWKNVTDQEKQRYTELVQKDTERFNKEMKEFKETGFYTNAAGVNSKFMDRRHRVQEFQIGTVMPKKVTISYMQFSNEQQAAFKANKKEDEKYSCVETTKKISQLWKDMTEAQKAKYEEMAQKDQERYNKQLDDIRKNGFFTTDDGVKSTDLIQKVKKVKRTKKTLAIKEQV